jgi:hypothetical protein
MRRRTDGTFVSTDRPILFVLGALGFAFAFAMAMWHRFQSTGVDAGTVGFALGVGVALTGAGCFPVTRFVFDPNRKRIRWSARSLLNGDGGDLDFAQVQQVIVQTTTTEHGTLLYRVALRTADRTLPLAVEYTNGEQRAADLAASIRDLLNLSPAASP